MNRDSRLEHRPNESEPSQLIVVVAAEERASAHFSRVPRDEPTLEAPSRTRANLCIFFSQFCSADDTSASSTSLMDVCHMQIVSVTSSRAQAWEQARGRSRRCALGELPFELAGAKVRLDSTQRAEAAARSLLT